MQSKFWKIYREFVTEQQDPEQPQAVASIEGGAQQPDASAPAAAEPAANNQQDTDGQLPKDQLDSSGFVTLVRLLKIAFVVRPKEEDAGNIMDIGEINGTNVYDKFRTILSLIKKYSPDVDIDMSLNQTLK